MAGGEKIKEEEEEGEEEEKKEEEEEEKEEKGKSFIGGLVYYSFNIILYILY